MRRKHREEASEVEVVGLTDGSGLVIADMDAPEQVSVERAPDVLGVPSEVMAWIAEAVAAGVTFDVLKAITASLVGRGWRRRPAPATAESITRAVTSYLRSCGYVDIRVTDARLVPGEGWTLQGIANGLGFKGLTDEGGNVIHVRVK